MCLIASTQIEDLLPALVELLRESVNGGAPLGFLPPLSADECRNYWLSLRAELRAGSRLLFGVWVGGSPGRLGPARAAARGPTRGTGRR